MWRLLGQPSRSGYNYDYDHLDDAPAERAWTWSEFWLSFGAFLLIFVVLPLMLLVGLTIYVGTAISAIIRTRISSTAPKKGV